MTTGIHQLPPEYHHDIIQRSAEWHDLRCGMITASAVEKLMTAGKKPASNATSRGLMYELAAQRITGYVEPSFVSDDMLRGQEDEIEARAIYEKHQGVTVAECGFVVARPYDFPIGYSPDGLVGDDGLIEIKSRKQKFQLETILNGEVPAEYMLQCQTGLLVTGRKWLDFISYSGGLPMVVLRVWPDEELHQLIIETCAAAEQQIAEIVANAPKFAAAHNWPPTVRKVYEDILA
jgi:putative phage-type endonuclease